MQQLHAFDAAAVLALRRGEDATQYIAHADEAAARLAAQPMNPSSHAFLSFHYEFIADTRDFAERHWKLA